MSAINNVVSLISNSLPSIYDQNLTKEDRNHREQVRQQFPLVTLRRELLTTFVETLNGCYSLIDLDEIKALYWNAHASSDPAALTAAIHALRGFYVVKQYAVS